MKEHEKKLEPVLPIVDQSLLGVGSTREKIEAMKLPLQKNTTRLVTTILWPDTHVPFHDPQAVRTALKFTKAMRPDRFVIIGDFMDCMSVSKFKNKHAPGEVPTLQEEIEESNYLLDTIQGILPRACKRYYIGGNHEKRVEHYLWSNAAEIYNLKKNKEDILSIPYLLNLNKRGYDYIPYEQSLRLDGVNIEHGDRVSQHSAYTAKAMLDRRRIPTVIGHTHRAGTHYFTGMDETMFSHEIGCLIDRNSPAASYSKNPNWTQAIGIMQHDPETGLTQVTPLVMQNYRLIWQGKVVDNT